MRKLEIGCGRKINPGYERMDANSELPALDYCGPAQERLPWDDNTFGEIRAVDVLEHISYRETLPALTEWCRIMKPGGRLYVQVPDVRTAVTWWLSNPDRLMTQEFAHLPPIVSLAWRMMGGHADGEITQDGDDWRWNAHYAMFDTESLAWYLVKAGFDVESIVTNPFPNLLAWAIKR